MTNLSLFAFCQQGKVFARYFYTALLWMMNRMVGGALKVSASASVSVQIFILRFCNRRIDYFDSFIDLIKPFVAVT